MQISVAWQEFFTWKELLKFWAGKELVTFHELLLIFFYPKSFNTL